MYKSIYFSSSEMKTVAMANIFYGLRRLLDVHEVKKKRKLSVSTVVCV